MPYSGCPPGFWRIWRMLLGEWSQHSQQWIHGSPIAVIFASDTFSKASTVPPILLQIHLFHFSSAFWNILWWMSVLYKLVIRSSCSDSYIQLTPSVSGLFKVWVSHCQETWLHQSSIWVLFAKKERTNLNEECLDGLWDPPGLHLQSCDLACWDKSKVAASSTSALTGRELFRCRLKLESDLQWAL